ncbi:endophilin-A2-like isoform X2 [Stigmatopora nigra]
MSVAGFRKQLIKASQMVSEKVGGAEGTKLDEDFKDLERRADITSKAVVEVVNRTTDYLQPNPAHRTKLSMLNSMSKIRGQANSLGYPQTEGLLADSMMKYGMEMGNQSNFGEALQAVGESMKKLSATKDSLDIDVKQNFLDPLQRICDKDIKDIQHHKKKMESRRLDYDYKKKRQGKIPEEELRQALEKFDESKENAETSMYNLLETDVEQVSQLAAFVEAVLQYHRNATEILEELSEDLTKRVQECQSQPKREYRPKPRQASFDYDRTEQSNGGSPATSPPAYSPAAEPSCRALYDFSPENQSELGFREGDIITLVSYIDENWLEGRLHGKTGYLPINYVEVIVPLP